MARIRTVKIGFFRDEELCAFGPWHRLLFQGLWLLADRAGRLEDKPRTIKAEVFPFDDCVDVDAMLSDLAQGANPFITRYAADGRKCIQVLAFHKHQRPHFSEPESAIPPPGGMTAESSAATAEKVVSPTLGREGNGKEGKGREEAVAPVWKQRGHNPHTLALSSTAHVRCDPYTAGACARGLCVPAFLVNQWRLQVSAEDPDVAASYVRAFVSKVVADMPPGPAGDPVKFWRAEWQRAHPTKTLSKAEQSIAAAQRVLKRIESKEEAS